MGLKILLRDFRSVVKQGQVVNFNIGTTAHGPGVAAMLEKVLPDCEICFWASAPLSAPLERMIQRRFPNTRLVSGSLDGSSPAVEDAVRWCDFLLIGSGTRIAVRKDVEAFVRYSGKPYGAAGIGYTPQDLDAMQKSNFMFFRDSLALKHAREDGLRVPTGFVPDGAFAFDALDEVGAETFMRHYGLEPGKFACCLPRYRNTPLWEFVPGCPYPEERIAYNKRMLQQDMAPLVEAASRLVRQTHWKVLLSPETEPATRLCQNELAALFPSDVRPFIVVPEVFWEADLALGVYTQSCGLFGTEMHSQVMAIGNGIPAMVCRTAEFGSKSQMWCDISLDDWLFDFDFVGDRQRFPDAVLQMFTQRDKTNRLLEKASSTIQERFEFFAEFLKQHFA
ncbi:MAG: polysaccharide pyruvyl transferase family protein [Victivallales bacterium]|nr:polysaccharide pyruvyl transferase family protein [Victivallales bacterium]